MADRQTVTQVRFRLRQDLLKKLQRAAKAADRSVNEQLELCVEEYFRKEKLSKVIKQTAETVLMRSESERDPRLSSRDPEVRFEAMLEENGGRIQALEEKLQQLEQLLDERLPQFGQQLEERLQRLEQLGRERAKAIIAKSQQDHEERMRRFEQHWNERVANIERDQSAQSGALIRDKRTSTEG